MSEARLRLFIPGFLLFYFLFGFSRWITYQVEIYPFGAWGMFHRIDKVWNDFDLAVHRLGERSFDPPALASDPDNAAGIDRTGELRLVLNGFVRHTEAGRTEQAERYRDFLEREILGPDAEYEVLMILDRSRPHEYPLIRVKHFGPFVSDPDLAAPTGEDFAYRDTGHAFRKRPERTKRRTKKKKSAR